MISLLNVYLLGSIGAFAWTAFNRYNLYDNYFAFALSYWADPMTKIILYNFCFACMILFQKIIALMVFGEIKQNEKTKILEKLKLKSLEILFIAVILHDQFTFPVFALALGLVVSFVLHHLTVLRSEYLINTHNLYLNEHARLLAFYLIILFVDFEILKHSWSWIVAQNNMSIVFSFYVLQFFLLLLEPCAKFTIYLYERFTGYEFNELDAKLNLIGFAINLPRLLLLNVLGFYIMIKFRFSFFFVFMIIELIVELIQLLRNFSKVRGLGKMMESLPKIDRAQIERLKMDDTCMICFREIYEGVEVPSCNHIFHTECLKQWIHKNTNHFCPKCKKPFNFPEAKGQEPVLVNRQELREEPRLEEPGQVNRDPQEKDGETELKQKIKNFMQTNPRWQQYRQAEDRRIQLEKELETKEEKITVKDEGREQKAEPKMIKISELLHQTSAPQTKSRSPLRRFPRVGGVAFGIPHQAIYHRRPEDFSRRQEVVALNKTISSFLDQSQYKRTLLISQN